LLCLCHDQAVRLLDEILDLADQAVGEAHGQALRELRDLKAQKATAADGKVALFDLLVGLLLDEDVADDEVRARAWEAMAPERWAAAREQGQAILRPLDDNRYAQLDGRYAHLRRFVPALIAALRFEGVPAACSLIDAVELLRELDATGWRALPDTAPTAFVPARWRAHVIGEDGRPDRRRWELCLLSELRSALRSGAVWVQGSRRYQPASAPGPPSATSSCTRTARHPAGRLLAHPLNLDVIRDGWDDLVRCAASLRDGTVTASLLVARLQPPAPSSRYSRAAGVRAARRDPVRARLSRRRDRAPRHRPPAEQTREPARPARPHLARQPRHRPPAHPPVPIHAGALPAPRRQRDRPLDHDLHPTRARRARLRPRRRRARGADADPVRAHQRTYDFSSDRPAGQLRLLRAAAAA
jgi:hypothetical protein